MKSDNKLQQLESGVQEPRANTSHSRQRLTNVIQKPKDMTAGRNARVGPFTGQPSASGKRVNTTVNSKLKTSAETANAQRK